MTADRNHPRSPHSPKAGTCTRCGKPEHRTSAELNRCMDGQRG